MPVGVYIRHSIEARFWSKVNKDGPIVVRGEDWPVYAPDPPGTPCWLWTAYARRGYGQFTIDGKDVSAHSWPHEQKHGPIPKGFEPDHLCRTRSCVREDHLEIVTKAENIRRGRGADRHRAKTHCPRGHEYTTANLVPRPEGWRDCRTCHNARTTRYDRTRKRGPVTPLCDVLAKVGAR